MVTLNLVCVVSANIKFTMTIVNKISAYLVTVIVICGLIALLSSSIQANDASVEGARTVLVQLAKLSKKQAVQSEAAQKLLTSEMLALKIASFGKLSDAPDKVLLLEKNQAVGRFQLFGENNQVTDVYFYLQYENSWKVSAVRLLSLTGIIEQIYLGLKAKPQLTKEEKSLFENSKLTLAPDKELKTWFVENRRMLDKLLGLLHSKSNKTALYVNRDDKKFPEAAELLQKLNLSTANIDANGNAEFVIGGITDNTVGFGFSPSKNLPKISPSGYIWVEEMAPAWYLFRTT